MSEKSKKSPFGAYDVRGVYGDNITEELAQKLGFAISQYLGLNSGRFVIGHDTRSSSPGLATALAKGINLAGNEVMELGVASTPRVYWHGAINQFDCSIAVTASHLPAKHNGFKICRESAVPISSEDGLLEIEQIVKTMHIPTPTSEAFKTFSKSLSKDSNAFANKSGFHDYVGALAQFLQIIEPLKIVVDAGGSPIGRELTELFKKTKLTIIPLGFEEDGDFSRRSPNPIDEGALDELRQTIKDSQANFGAAFDGDGDRVVFLDENGSLIDPDLITALLATRMLAHNPGAKVMYDLRSSRAVMEQITASGGIAIKSRVGHSFIKADMRKEKVLLAGELSAHYYFADMFYTDNAVRALIEITNLISEKSVPLSSLVDPLKRYANTGEINFKIPQRSAVVEALKERFKQEKIDYTDGISVDFADWWFNLRTSQTEPLVRLCIGALTPEILEKHRTELELFISDSIVESPLASKL